MQVRVPRAQRGEIFGCVLQGAPHGLFKRMTFRAQRPWGLIVGQNEKNVGFFRGFDGRRILARRRRGQCDDRQQGQRSACRAHRAAARRNKNAGPCEASGARPETRRAEQAKKQGLYVGHGVCGKMQGLRESSFLFPAINDTCN